MKKKNLRKPHTTKRQALVAEEKLEKYVPAKYNPENYSAIEVSGNPESLIIAAIRQGSPMDVIERMVALRDKFQSQEAERAFRAAMSRFQTECPIVGKSKGVDFTGKSGKRVQYDYAPLGVIVSEIKEILGKYDLSYTFTTSQDIAGFVTAICHAHHALGHTESTSFTIPIDPEAFMNPAQKVASALTYAKRYALCNAFGILTGDEDDDAGTPEDIEKQKAENEAKRKREEEAKTKLDALPENIKEGFRILGYTARAAWILCNDREWKNDLIKAEIEKIISKQEKE